MRFSTLNPQPSTPLPFVLVNMAMTADGKIATANRLVSSFGSRRDQEHLLQLRATADAVMAGARTVDSNPVNLGPAPPNTAACACGAAWPNSTCASSSAAPAASIPTPTVFQRGFSPIIILTTRRATAARLKQLRAVASEVKICGAQEINFPRALRWLRKKWGIKRLLCEGGGELNDALFRAGLVNELHLTVCPRIFGGRAAPTIADGLGAGSLARAARLELQSARRHGRRNVPRVSGPQVNQRHSRREVALLVLCWRSEFAFRCSVVRSPWSVSRLCWCFVGALWEP